jgi:GNAT superfamily N-acetyltransferase
MSIPTALLLVDPPMGHPAFFSTGYCRAVGVLRRMGVQVHDFHGGADFIAYIMRPEVRDDLVARARRQARQGHPAYADSATATPAAALTQEARVWQDLFKEYAFTPADMQTEAFFDPVTAAVALARIDQALALISLAYPPALIDRRGFIHPGLHNEADMSNWISDEDRNPFYDYARRYCRPPVAPAQCEQVVIVVDSPGRLAGALTLARIWREQAPQTAITLLFAHKGLRTVAQSLADRLIGPNASCGGAGWIQQVRQAVAFGGADTEFPMERRALLLPAEAGEAKMRTRIRTGRLQVQAMQALLDASASADTGTMVWHDPEGEAADLSALLYRAAKQGFWNHVVLQDWSDCKLIDGLVRFAAANPNIIHSWCRRIAPASVFSDSRDIFPEGNPPYGSTRPLPGQPLWQQLQDPVYLSAYAARYGAKQVARMFLMPDHRSVHVAGSQMVYRFMPPSQLPDGHLDEIVRMVDAGGSVQTQWVRHNLERAFLIGYVEENGVIIGDSSLKHPREEYIEAVSRQTGIDLRNYLERGYTSVRPEYRSLGVGAKLLEGLTARAEGYKVYSIIAEDNVATQKMALRNRTRKVAVFYSQRSRKTIGVWIPEWMLPEGIDLPPQPDLV